MCTNFRPPSSRLLRDMQGMGGLQIPVDVWPEEAFPGHVAPIVTRGDPDTGLVCSLARFGLVPRWSRDAEHGVSLSRHTHNARSETVAEKPSFRAPWRERRYALVPMLCYFEPCWETGRAVRWRIGLSSGEPCAVAGLHERWTDRHSGEVVQTFTLLTVNADGHPLMGRMHRPADEKRRLVIVPPGLYPHWLQATPGQAAELLQHPPDPALQGEPAPRIARVSPAGQTAPTQGALDF